MFHPTSKIWRDMLTFKGSMSCFFGGVDFFCRTVKRFLRCLFKISYDILELISIWQTLLNSCLSIFKWIGIVFDEISHNLFFPKHILHWMLLLVWTRYSWISWIILSTSHTHCCNKGHTSLDARYLNNRLKTVFGSMLAWLSCYVIHEILYKYNLEAKLDIRTLPKTNIAPGSRPSQRETSILTIHLQVLC